MKRAIKILENHIEKINKEMDKTQMIINEPELMSDYHFGMAEMANFEMDVIELQKAIEILNKHVV